MLDADEVRRLLDYDPATGIFRWRVRTSSRAAANSVAGFDRHDGYRLIGIGGRIYLAHRLAWVHVHGEWPEAEIDHIDCNPANNALANLRPATRALNQRNSRKPRNNSSGVKGVTWHAKDAKWQAQIKLRGRCHYLGQFDDIAQAATAYASASVKLHGEFGRLA